VPTEIVGLVLWVEEGMKASTMLGKALKHMNSQFLRFPKILRIDLSQSPKWAEVFWESRSLTISGSTT